MEDDHLEVDSPEHEPVDDIEDEEIDELHLPGTPGASTPSTPQTSSLRPPFKRAKLKKPKEKPRETQLEYQRNLPYEAESLDEMDRRLEEIVRHLIDCVRAKDYDVGFVQWNHRLECWISLKYPMRRDIRARLARLYFETAVLPGMDARLVDIATNQATALLEPLKRIDITDLQLPWRRLYAILEKELFPKSRKTGLTNISSTLLSLTEFSQRFFPPHEIPAMLDKFLPRLSPSLNSFLATQAFCTHFLPLSHPQYYLSAVFKLWQGGFNSGIWDEQWLDFVDRLARLHLDPARSDPDIIDELRQIAKEKGEFIEERVKVEHMLEPRTETAPAAADYLLGGAKATAQWNGIRKDVGIFSEEQFAFIMTKCLRAMGVPVGGGGKTGGQGVVASDFSRSDDSANSASLTMKKPAERLTSFATIIVSSMSEDSRPSGSTGTATPAEGMQSSLKDQTYLGGSKALDALGKLIQATESYFHPSNYGAWAPNLGRFLQNVTWEFHRRWMEEQKSDCKTPKAWRLTPNIRLEVVKTMRTVALLSMFSRDPITIACSQQALKIMSLLEPELVFPAILERAFPALEGLLETHRTTAVITALSTTAPALLSRNNYAPGAKHLLPLLELCLPGLDVNDPLKTMSTAMFIIQATSSLMLDDLTRPDIGLVEGAEPMTVDEPLTDNGDAPRLAINGEPQLSRREEDELVRMSTAGFPDWVSSFFRQVMTLFDALPEPGKGSRNGGKIEDQMTQTIIAACDFVCAHLSPPLFDLALDIVYREISTSARSNSARAVSQLVSCFARANSVKTLKKCFSACDIHIRGELEGGASSTRTTSSNTPIESDVTLHWWIGILTGAITNGGDALLTYKESLQSLIKFMIEHCKSERGYTSSARVLAIALISMTNCWVRDYRCVNPDVWDSQAWKHRHHEQWGQLFEVKDVNINWHVPSEAEIDWVIEMLKDIVDPAVDVVERLLSEDGIQDKSEVWTNDFCRHLNVLRSALSGIPGLVWLGEPTERGTVASDAGDEDPGFISVYHNVKAGIKLTDPNDPRFQYVASLRQRTGTLLHEAVQTLKRHGREDSIDSVKMIISTIRVYMLDYPCDHSHYSAVKKTYDFALQVTRTTRNQKMFPRYVWVRRASLYHASRLRLNSFYRKRTPTDDLLIADMCELSLSLYLQIRRSAQRGLDQIIHYFDGTRTLIYPRLFQALTPGTHHDVMKGALFVLGSKAVQNFAILDWRPDYAPAYIKAILACSHQERPSVQNLVKTVSHDYVIRLAEPSSLRASVDSEGLRSAAEQLEHLISVPEDAEMVRRVAAKAQGRIEQKNDSYSALVPQLVEFAKSSQTHWRYALTATRFLRALVRRDQPLRKDVTTYMAEQLISDLPHQRTHAMLALTKVLHFVKLRTMSEGSPEKLLLQQTTNPLKSTVKLEQPLPVDFTDKFIAAFKEPLTADTLLTDKQSTGWLVWGDSVKLYKTPPETESAIKWDETSKETLDELRAIIMQSSWWETFIGHLSQEKSIDYLAADAITIIKSIFQVFEDEPLKFVMPIVDGMIPDKTDRHKQRACGELIGGIVRGSKHWPLVKQRSMWSWLEPKLSNIFQGITPETQIAWEMCAEYILQARDPRRNKPLVDYLTSLTIDTDSSEAFNTSKEQDLVGMTIKSLGWWFTPWSKPYIDMYTQCIAHSYQEVRSAVSENLRNLSEMRLHPSFASVQDFLRSCESAKDAHSLMSIDQEYENMIDGFKNKLQELHSERQPASQGTQAYDRAASSILLWIWSSISDFRVSTTYPFITKLLPEFFRMQEILDNDELRSTAGRVLIACACLQYPIELVRPLMSQFIEILKTSPNWRTRLDVMQPLQMFYFHNIFLLDSFSVIELMEVLCDQLRDPKIEVREAAANTLSGIVRCSQRSAILTLSSRFMNVLRSVKIPKRRNEQGEEVNGYQEALVAAHSAVLGVSSLVNAFPYEVPPFIPGIMLETALKHSASPVPLSTTIRSMLSGFKQSHTDSWQEDQKAFTESQLQDLHDLLMGSSYYA
ncbi:Proteasome activator BLM10 [Microbotryomycetes sp. JL221]|nr:Proteasome activator BLM10 [Microbotryomycetes sp. JL221]